MCERRLAQLAGQDDVNTKGGLELRINTVSDWAMTALHGVRKLRVGKHRLYITGRHTDCHYTLCYVLMCKRDEDDKPDTKRYKAAVEAGMDDAIIARRIENPDANVEAEQG